MTQIPMYVVDTCVLNRLIDGKLLRSNLPSDGRFVATHIQIDELNRTKDEDRRSRLFLMFSTLRPEIFPVESFVWDVSRFGHAKWGDGKTAMSLKSDLDQLNGGKQNNIQDALIAEVAIRNGFTLLTTDRDLREVAARHGAKVQLLP